MAESAVEGHDGRVTRGFDRAAVVAVVIGGLMMTALFVPFTLAHGPTSFNEERLVLGFDMHRWGLLLGVLPNLLIGAGLWRLRKRITAGRREPSTALVILCCALMLDGLLNLGLGSLGAPFVLFILAPTILALAAVAPAGGLGRVRLRVLLAALGVSLAVGVALALLAQATSDAFGGYRVFGILVYGVGGLLWASLGASLASLDVRQDS